MRRPDCPACGLGRYEFLDTLLGTTTSTLCGRNAVQVVVRSNQKLDLAQVEAQLAPLAARLARNEYLLKAEINGYEFTVFPDNRAIIKGTDDESVAKTLYARYIGN